MRMGGKEFCNLYSNIYIVSVTKSRKNIQARHVGHTGEKEIQYISRKT
jgi:hypothetical protein